MDYKYGSVVVIMCWTHMNWNFLTGFTAEYTVDDITENLFNQTNNDGWDTGLLSEVIGLRKDKKVAISREKGAINSYNGQNLNNITTKGWDVQVKWDDQSTSWIPLNIVNESNPIELEEYAHAKGYEEESAFKWWVRRNL